MNLILVPKDQIQELLLYTNLKADLTDFPNTGSQF